MIHDLFLLQRISQLTVVLKFKEYIFVNTKMNGKEKKLNEVLNVL